MRTLRILLFTALLAPSLFADTYIAVWRPQGKLPDPVLSDYHATLVLAWGSRMVVRMTPADAARLRDNPRVRYVQRIQDTAGTSPSVMRAGTDAFRAEVTAALPDWSTGTFSYDGVGNIVAMSDDGDHQTRLYTYDLLNRLSRQQNGTQFFEYKYDGFGNRVQKKSDAYGEMVWDANLTNNQLTTAHYNAIGSVDGFNGNTYDYDNANMMSRRLNSGKTEAEVAIYTADDERLALCDPDKCDWTVRGPDQKVRRELESQSIVKGARPQYWLWIEDYVYRNGQLLGAQRESREGGRRNFHLDHLGTPRVTTGSGGQQLARSEYEPFGEEITDYTADVQVSNFERPEPMRFTGHQRDFSDAAAMYMDYMHARYYAPGAGRFLSVDPVVVSAHGEVPQTWNRYSYGRNNPVRLVDPDGRDPDGHEPVLRAPELMDKLDEGAGSNYMVAKVEINTGVKLDLVEAPVNVTMDFARTGDHHPFTLSGVIEGSTPSISVQGGIFGQKITIGKKQQEEHELISVPIPTTGTGVFLTDKSIYLSIGLSKDATAKVGIKTALIKDSVKWLFRLYTEPQAPTIVPPGTPGYDDHKKKCLICK